MVETGIEDVLIDGILAVMLVAYRASATLTSPSESAVKPNGSRYAPSSNLWAPHGWTKPPWRVNCWICWLSPSATRTSPPGDREVTGKAGLPVADARRTPGSDEPIGPVTIGLSGVLIARGYCWMSAAEEQDRRGAWEQGERNQRSHLAVECGVMCSTYCSVMVASPQGVTFCVHLAPLFPDLSRADCSCRREARARAIALDMRHLRARWINDYAG